MIYLDNNATTPVDPVALDSMLPFLRDDFANPSGAYTFARHIRPALDTAHQQIAALLGCDPSEVVITSGGTESDTTAILSATHTHPNRKHLVSCATEHPAVLAPIERLVHDHGYESTIVGVCPDGRIDLDALREAVRPGQTALVSLMWANNETGVIHPLLEAAEIAAAAGALFHTDAVQAAGKIPLALRDNPAIHFLSISGHKIHAPKGVGALYVSRNTRFRPLIEGGGQENNRRSGTENVAGIVALGAAARQALNHLEANQSGCDPIAALRDRFESRVRSELDGVHVNGSPTDRTPNTSSLRFDHLEAEGLIILMDKAGLCCSAGSACHAGALKPSAILTAMGLDPAAARSTLRFSLSRFTTPADIAAAADIVVNAARKLRSLRPSGSRVLPAS